MTNKEKSFKKNWKKKDEICPTCHQVTNVARGLTKQNIGKLFKKPTFQEMIIFILIILALLGALSYQLEIQQYQNIIRDPQELCDLYYQNLLHGNFGDMENINFSNNQNIITIPSQK